MIKETRLTSDGYDERTGTLGGEAHIVLVRTFGRGGSHHCDAPHTHMGVEHHRVNACEHLVQCAVIAMVSLVEIGKIDLEVNTRVSLTDSLRVSVVTSKARQGTAPSMAKRIHATKRIVTAWRGMFASGWYL